MKHWYAIKMDTIDNHDNFEIRYMVCEAYKKTGAIIKAKKEMKHFDIAILYMHVESFDTAEGAAWKISQWEQEERAS